MGIGIIFSGTGVRVRMAHEVEAAERRMRLTGAVPWVELAPGVSLPGIQKGKRRYALASAVRAWLEVNP